MNQSQNPRSDLPPPLASEPEVVRKQYLNHEASIQSIGVLYLIGAVMMFCASGVGLLKEEGPLMQRLAISGLLVVLAGLYIWLGRKLRVLDPVARTPATVLACIGLLAFPLGTLINIYILYLLQSKKGKFVFSPEYREIINATPQIKYRISIVIWILLGLVVALMLVGLGAAFLGPKH